MLLQVFKAHVKTQCPFALCNDPAFLCFIVPDTKVFQDFLGPALRRAVLYGALLYEPDYLAVGVLIQEPAAAVRTPSVWAVADDIEIQRAVLKIQIAFVRELRPCAERTRHRHCWCRR